MIDSTNRNTPRDDQRPPAGGIRSFAARLFSDELLRHSAILFSGMIVVHACNFSYQMVVSRILPEAEYVLLAAFLAVLAIIQNPLSTLSIGVSHYSNLLRREGRAGDIKRLLRKWILRTTFPAILLGAIAILLSTPLAGLLNMNRAAPVVIVGALLPALFCLPVLSGAGQGLQLFGWGALAVVFGALVRLALGAGFVWYLYPTCEWAMLGHGLAIYATAALILFGIMLMLRGQDAGQTPLPSMRFYLLQSFFIRTAYAVLMTADVVLVKHFLPEDTEFAYAATLSRLVVFLPGVIVVAMFPKVTSPGSITPYQATVFLRSLGWTALLASGAVLGCSIFAGTLARILFGIADASDYLKQMIGLMALVMGCSALLNVIIQFLVAQRRFQPACIVIALAVLYVCAALLFHASAWQVALSSAICNAGALAALLLMLWRNKCFSAEAGS